MTVLTSPRDQESPLFVVDDDHLGTAESVWLGDERLAGLQRLQLPDVARLLMVAAHPDDEVLGAAGLLQCFVASGRPVELCSVTDGEASNPAVGAELRDIRIAEWTAALGRLGATRTAHIRLRQPDGGVGDHEDELAAVLATRLDPDTLCVAPWRHDGHPDHEACGRAAAAAAEAVGAPLLEFPLWAWHWATPESQLPWDRLRRFELTADFRRRKRQAISEFASQIRPYGPGAQSAILPPATLARFHRSFETFVM